MTFPPLILASQSPRRRELMKQVGFRFRIVPSKVEEIFDLHSSPRANARRIALEKGREVATRVKRGIVVSADTIVVCGKRILGKPESKADARRMLRLLSGRRHDVYTCLALIDAATGKTMTVTERTRVYFRRLSHKEIERYIATDSPFDKAGAYGIQDDHGAIFVEKVEGCFYNVMGLPLSRLYVALQTFLKSRG
ncbi:MAG TPA: nucleoside triphosphate pyrophosphatase [Bacteroidota bacterium]|nr:nucleoside triphosphate pyrophosphatase [Bacteroidota bacterium]